MKKNEGSMLKLQFTNAALMALAGYTTWLTFSLLNPGPPPQLDPNEWWGPQEANDTTIRPFQVNFTDEMITDLRMRLKNYRSSSPPLEGVEFQYGFNSKQLAYWANYWADQYPFKVREKYLNQFLHYKTNIQGLDIHFIREQPEIRAGVPVVPLLMMHGWPGSVVEFLDVIPLLMQQTHGTDFVFEVVVPSLPGVGYSDSAVRPGLGPAQVAVVLKNLMNRLGHKKFYIQGGGWGAIIGSIMSTIYPDDILGHHNNMPFVQNGCTLIRTIVGAFIPSLIVDPHLEGRMYPLWEKLSYLMEESGYFHLQATKPDTIGVGLSDSPIGLLAYVLEKFSTWTNIDNRKLSDGGLTTFSAVTMLDNLMVYWSTNTITTSMRLYAEHMSRKNRALAYDRYPSPVPVWFLQAKNDLVYQSPTVLKIKYYNIIGTTVLNYGGHYIAVEMPKQFAEDICNAVRAFRNYHAGTHNIKP